MALILTVFALKGNFALFKSLGDELLKRSWSTRSVLFRFGLHTYTKVWGRHSYGSAEEVAHTNGCATRGRTWCPLLASYHPQKRWQFFSANSKVKNSCPNIGDGSAVNGDFHSQSYQVSDKWREKFDRADVRRFGSLSKMTFTIIKRGQEGRNT